MARQESHLEKFIVDLVRERVTEHVRLHLSDVITVRPVQLRTKGGAHLLATFWANVLQHRLNFPPSEHSYRRHEVTEENCQKQLLELTLKEEDGHPSSLKIYVDMSTGVITFSGQFVYEWFTTRFRRLLENFDSEFAASWTYIPTPVGDLPDWGGEVYKERYEKTETEAYLLLEGRGCQSLCKSFVDRFDGQLSSDPAADMPPTSKLRSSKNFWPSEEVLTQLTALGQCGGIFDSFTFIYPLWRSTLHHWFSQSDGSSVYLATPFIDADRLCDIIDICCEYRESNIQLAALYVNYSCDSTNGAHTAPSVQREALRRYTSTPQFQAFAEYRVVRQITYPLKRHHLGAAFLARVSRSGSVEMLLTGSSFHDRDFCADGRKALAAYVQMTKEIFTKRYIEPLEVPAVTLGLIPK